MNGSLKKPTCILKDGTSLVQQFLEVAHQYIEKTKLHLGTYTKENMVLPVDISTVCLVKQQTIPFEIENLTHFRAVMNKIISKI